MEIRYTNATEETGIHADAACHALFFFAEVEGRVSSFSCMSRTILCAFVVVAAAAFSSLHSEKSETHTPALLTLVVVCTRVSPTCRVVSCRVVCACVTVGMGAH